MGELEKRLCKEGRRLRAGIEGKLQGENVYLEASG